MIETDRLRLRPHRIEDFNRYLPLWSLPEPPGTHAPDRSPMGRSPSAASVMGRSPECRERTDAQERPGARELPSALSAGAQEGPPVQLSPEDAWSRLLRFVGHWSHFGFGLFIVEERSSGEIVGEVGLAHFRRGLGPRFDDAPEAAWRVLATRRGSGIASEAMAAALAWFDRAFAAERTVCLIHVANERSIRVAAKLGYRTFGQSEFRGAMALLCERTRHGSTELGTGARRPNE